MLSLTLPCCLFKFQELLNKGEYIVVSERLHQVTKQRVTATCTPYVTQSGQTLKFEASSITIITALKYKHGDNYNESLI